MMNKKESLTKTEKIILKIVFIAVVAISFFYIKHFMEKQPYIKIIRGEKEYCYTKKDWDFAWFLTWLFGVLVGAMGVLIINSFI